MGRAQSLDGQARTVAALRLEVDELSKQVQAERTRLSQVRERLEREALDLELSMARAEARRAAARRQLERARSMASRAEGRTEALVPVLVDAALMLEAHVRDGLPFRSRQRLEALAEIRRGLEQGSLAPDRAASRLWRHLREELRLAESSGLGRQVVPVAGETILADVARLGLVALLFRLPDGRVGYTRPGPEGQHRFILTDNPSEADAIARSFEALARGRAPGRLLVPVSSLGVGEATE